jgi:putative spermidine/putrescine transport system permease protein
MKRALFLYACAVVAFILAPAVVVVIASFGTSEVTEFPPRALSFKWYGHALSQKIFVDAAWNSAWLALVATAIATPVALAAAIAIVRYRFPGKDAVQSLLLAPLVVPAIVTGLAILLAFSAVGIRDVPTRLIGAHVLVVTPYLVRTIMASLAQVDPMLEECARTLGASGPRAFWHVTLPLIRPGLVAGMLFAFILSFDNVSVSLFLTNVRTNTLPLAMLNYVEYNFDPSIAAIASMLVFFSLGSAVLLERMVGLKRLLGS